MKQTVPVSDPTRRGPLAALALLGLLGPLAAPAGAQEPPPLTSAVPDDVFLVTSSRHNPERQFLEVYWGGVWEAFRASGVVEDMLDLVLAPAADEALDGELERLRGRFGELCGAVDWDALGSGEVVFAERMDEPLLLPGGVPLGTPEVVLLFRTEGDAHARVFEAWSALLEAIVDELGAVVGAPLAVERSASGAAQLVSVDLLQLVPEAPRYPISIGTHGDVLFLTSGLPMLEDVMGLLSGAGEGQAIAASARFRSALGQLPEPEDGFEYVDVQRLRDGIGGYLGGVFTQLERELPAAVADRIENTRREGEAFQRGREGLAAYQAGDLEEALRLTREGYALDPTDTVLVYNLACLHALLERPDEALDWLERAVEGGFWAPGRIEADPDLESLRGEPRYAAAVQRATEQAGGPQVWLRAVRSLLDRTLDSIGVVDHSATVHRTEGSSVFSDSITALVPGAERIPVHRLVASARDVEDFARYLPAESTSFSVAGGVDPELLYGFLEESLAETGTPGQQALAAWRGFQDEQGFDLREDLLAWLGGATVSASFPLDGKDAWVLMLQVDDGPLAQEKLATGFERFPAMLAELSREIPALAMLALRTGPCTHEELGGFHAVSLGMMTTPAVCGVHDGWLVCGSSAEAVLLARATAAGEHPDVRTNEELMARALVPTGPVRAISFTDHEGDAEEAAAVFSGIGMTGGVVAASIPDPDARRVLTKLAAVLSKLAPVVAEIDFYDASAACTTFDGRSWRTLTVTHYVPPPTDH